MLVANLELLPSQMQDVVKICQKHGLAMADFQWERFLSIRAKRYVSRLRHKSSSYTFLFDRSPSTEYFLINFSPAETKPEQSQDCKLWKSTHRYIEKWLVSLKREIQAKDFLETAMSLSPLEHLAELQESNEPFTAVEQQRIAAKLDSIEQEILSTKGLLTDQAKLITEQFDFIKTESKRSGRKAFYYLFVGAVMEILTWCVSPADAQTLWLYAKTQMAEFFQGGPKLLK